MDTLTMIVMKLNTNKTLITQFYRNVVRLRKSEMIADYVSENYIQHSPMGKDGREGLLEMVAFLKKLPPVEESAPSPIVNLITEGDHVVAHLDLHFMGKHTVIIELFRLQDGLAVEHWDVTEDQAIKQQPIIDTTELKAADKNSILHLYEQKGILIHHLIADDEYIAIHAELKGGDRAFALFDIFKIENGKLTEHHFVKQEVPETMMHNNGMF